MKRIALIMSVLVISLFSFTFFVTTVRASENEKISALYQRGINEKIIDSYSYSYSDFVANYSEAKNIYISLLTQDSTLPPYDTWVSQQARYFATPLGTSGRAVKYYDRSFSSGQKASGNRLMSQIKKGDILIVQDGPLGHAAIATTDNYILEMSGGGNYREWFQKGIPNNNNQFSKYDWIFGKKKMITKYIELWRPSRNIAGKVADYADYTFWSSTHGFEKNRYINYLINANIYWTNPNYCSKLVWQSFWYGTGSLPVMKGKLARSFIPPYGLPSSFNASYSPYKVGVF